MSWLRCWWPLFAVTGILFVVFYSAYSSNHQAQDWQNRCVAVCEPFRLIVCKHDVNQYKAICETFIPGTASVIVLDPQ